MKQRTKRLFVTLAVCAVSALAVLASGCKSVGKWKDGYEQSRCEHVWSEGAVVKAATCEEAGAQTKTCTKCGKAETETISVLGHAWNDGEVVKAATCEEVGELAKTCTRCGKETTEEISALGHDWALESVTKESTCAEEGEGTYRCTKCSVSKTDSIPFEGLHTDNYGDAVCDVCGETGLTEAIITGEYHLYKEGECYRVYREDAELRICLGESQSDSYEAGSLRVVVPAKGEDSEAYVTDSLSIIRGYSGNYTQTIVDVYTYEDYVEFKVLDLDGDFYDENGEVLVDIISVSYNSGVPEYINKVLRIYELTSETETKAADAALLSEVDDETGIDAYDACKDDLF